MKGDLHVHTDISDSSLGFRETIRMAKENGITHLGITNHDTVRGLPEAIMIGKQAGVQIIPGIEISAFDARSERKVHLLGFGFELGGKHLIELCDPLLKRRNDNSVWQIDRLVENGYSLNLQNILDKAKSSKVIYKQHIMEELTECGYTESVYKVLYRKLFKNGGICDRDIEYVDVFAALKAIKADNGIAVLAHPGQQDSYDLIDELVHEGMDGIELYHPDHRPEDHERILTYGKKYGLLLTGGSDFHGDYGATAIGQQICPVEMLARLVTR